MKHIKKYETYYQEGTPHSPFKSYMKFQKGDWVRFTNLVRSNRKDLTIIYEIADNYLDMDAEQYRYWIFNIDTKEENEGWVLEGGL
jgi:hypothetical protein